MSAKDERNSHEKMCVFSINQKQQLPEEKKKQNPNEKKKRTKEEAKRKNGTGDNILSETWKMENGSENYVIANTSPLPTSEAKRVFNVREKKNSDGYLIVG